MRGVPWEVPEFGCVSGKYRDVVALMDRIMWRGNREPARLCVLRKIAQRIRDVVVERWIYFDHII